MSPVSQASPMGSAPGGTTRSNQGRRSLEPQTRGSNIGSMRKGARGMGLELVMKVAAVLWELSWLVDYRMRGGARMQV